MIQHASFKHGWFYHYRVHLPRSEALLTAYPSLFSYLTGLFEDCPHEKFQSGPRGSKLRFPVPVHLTEIPGHELCNLAAFSLAHGTAKTAHTKVEVGLLSADPKTISVEIPLWLDSHEHPTFQTVYGSDQALTGHIDILRIEGNRIWIWDYKPGAAKEKWAATQLNTYATMLAARTGIPLTRMRCGYFDHETSYVFSPVRLE